MSPHRLTTGLARYHGNLAEISADDLEADPDGRLMAADRLRARRNAELAPDHIDTLVAALIEPPTNPDASNPQQDQRQSR